MKYKIFLINLDEREDKFKSVKVQLDALGIDFERISAVRGVDLTEDDINSAYSSVINKNKYLKEMSVGEIGCYLSHRKVWAKIVDENLDFAVLIEDDAKLQDGFENVFELLNSLDNWDYVKLNGGRGGRKVIESLAMTSKHSLVHYDKAPVSTLAQGISLRGANKLLKFSRPFYRPVDVDIQLYWEKNIDVLGIEPKLVDKADFDSDIDNMSKGRGRSKKSGFWKRLTYRLALSLTRFKKNRARPNLNVYIVQD
jgi:glycosyl transferase family 25